ncbi:MAG TPA: hypothetical protein VEO54_28255 [Thermoanaerobaculia bacterium]|nr:hypothetical protein [Thermoanaerobaculia bacterium]
MLPWKLLCVLLLAVSAGGGVRPSESLSPFDPRQSAALFVGVQEFPGDRTLSEVRYAVDDAIDLAWLFALDPRVRLVPPERVVLAISGKPQKEVSEMRLQELIQADAVVKTATQSDIETLLERQAALVGSGGVLVAAFATHGFQSDGAPHVLASSSVFERRETAIPTAKLAQIAAAAPRSILFFDSCRERMRPRMRAASIAPPLFEGLTHTAGQAVFAISGQYTWDNPRTRNGAFTDAILGGLQCKAKTDARGLVTVETLHAYAEKRLLSWIRRHRDPDVATAVQLTADGAARAMPLALCTPPPPPVSPVHLAVDGASLIAFDLRNQELWRTTFASRVTRTELADLDGDGANEVVAAAGGALLVFRPAGERWWSADRIDAFEIGELYRRGRRQIVALSGTSLSVFDADGRLLSAYAHAGPLRHLAIAAPTARHKPKILVTAVNETLHDTLHLRGALSTLFMLDPKDVRTGTQLWYGYVHPAAQSIERLEILDRDNDGRRDIALTTSTGTLHLDFDGRIIKAKNAQFGLVK